MITAWLIGDKEVIAKFNAMPDRLQSGIARAVTRLSLEGARLSQQKVSGQVLNVRTGVLRSSIHPRPTERTATSITGGWGTNVTYARPQEFGVPHSWEITPKKARVLAFEVAGAQRKGGPHILSETVFAMRVTHPPLPERSFLRSALHEMEPRIKTELESAVSQELRR